MVQLVSNRSQRLSLILSPQMQIYKLMENDIYPRYLRSEEYQSLLRKGKESKVAGRGFFAKLQKKKFEGLRQDATDISPCLPHRFARSKVSDDMQVHLRPFG